MLDAFDLMEQAKWETEGARLAALRYREAAAAADPATLPSGQMLLRRLVPPLAAALKQAQADGADAIARGGNPPKWAWPIQLVAAEKLAVITLIHGLRAAMHPASSHPVTQLPHTLAQAVRAELDYASWMAAQKAAEDPAARHVLAAFKARYPDVTRRVWARWERKLALARTVWEEGTEVIFGMMLLQLLVDTSGGVFSFALGATRGKTPRVLLLDEETRATMADLETRAELARPLLLPMITPPLPWRYETTERTTP